MSDYTIDKLIADLMIKCGLGTVTVPIKPVSGGYMHRVYKVSTTSGTYAVKHLNPQIMSREGVQENYEQAETIERLLEKANIPIVPALTVLGQKMQTIDGHYFYIFRWQEGQITDWNNISNEMCRIAGTILGRLHAMNPQNSSHKESKFSPINWQQYIHNTTVEQTDFESVDAEISAILLDNMQLLTYAEKELNMARASLPDILCISNEDMDPKNIIWDNGNPWIIDLECLGYGNPISHALQLALQWSGVTTCSIDIENIAAFFDGYLAEYDNCFRAYSSVFGLAYSWVEWLAYNIQRALGACADEAERNMGIFEVRNTINRIQYLHQNEKKIKKALDSCMPPIRTDKYDNHDARICYYELMLEGDLTRLPQYELPAGYRFVAYTDNDRDAWIDIERSAKEFLSYEQGLEAWNRYYATRLEELPSRMFFIETNEGEKIATATALYDIYGRDLISGWLHWVAVKREYQGNGLSKPLITYVLREMNKLGYVHAKIPTQTTTWVACKVYMDLGFQPIEKNLSHSYEGWKIIKALTNHNTLRAL